MPEVGPGLTLVFTLLVVGGTFTFYILSRHRERMTMLERGIPFKDPNQSTGGMPLGLKLGILAIGLGSGMFSGFFVHNAIAGNPPALYAGFVMISGGFSLIVAYLIEFRFFKKKEDFTNHPFDEGE